MIPLAKNDKDTYVRPRCDDTNFKRDTPISRSFSDGPGFRHSVSRSYGVLNNQSDWESANTWPLRSDPSTWAYIPGWRSAYLNIKVLVNLHNLPECENILHQIRKLPAVSQTLEQVRFLGSLLGGSLHLGVGALSRYHRGDKTQWGRGGRAGGWRKVAASLSCSCLPFFFFLSAILFLLLFLWMKFF